MKQIYLDHAATTPVDPKVLEVMLPYFRENFGNPSAIYSLGSKAKSALEKARRKAAELIGADPKEIIFTSSGTESVNLAIKGIAEKYSEGGRHLVCSNIEHSAVLKSVESLKGKGFEASYVEADENGLIKPEKVKNVLKKDSILLSVMYANNEIGTVQNIKEIAKIAKAAGVPMHTDACQAAGALEINVKKLGVGLMSINGSKIYGPKGVGLLYKSNNLELSPQLHGGGQEFGLRSGTENLPLITGFIKALEIAEQKRKKEAERQTKLRDYFIKTALKEIPETQLNGHAKKRLPNNINLSFKGIEGENILMRLDMEGIIASSGSACASGSIEPSHVMLAIGAANELAHSSIRFSIGKSTTKKDIEKTLKALKEIVKDLRKFSPLF